MQIPPLSEELINAHLRNDGKDGDHEFTWTEVSGLQLVLARVVTAAGSGEIE